jgi:AcrR family transcriptional regulator
VGRYGYAGASIARITMAANVAQGTFYNYFGSRDALFAHLLPEIGRLMIDEIGAKVREHKRLADREEARIRGYLDFLRTHPGFYRVLREAETFAPEAHREHMANMVAGYTRALRAERERAGAPALPDPLIEKIVYMLLGARDYLAMRYQADGSQAIAADDETVATYMRAIRGGLFDDVPDESG